VTKSAQPTRLHPQRPGSSQGFTLIPERRDPPDLERFVAALLSFTLGRMEKEEAEREIEQLKANPPKTLKTRGYEVLIRASGEDVAAFTTELEGILVIERTKKLALEKIVVEIMATQKMLKRLGKRAQKPQISEKLRAVSTRHVVSVPQANPADLAVP
jgi:hypothetical protein